MSKIEVNTVDKQNGSTVTVGGPGTNVVLGSSGQSVSIACGATTSGMGRAGTVDWCSTVYTNSPGTVTGVSGKGYFLNTTSGAITINLPSSPSVGDIISIKDYLNTFDSNNVTVGRGGSKIGGLCLDATLGTEGQSITLIYADATRGWLNVQTDSTIQGSVYVTASGGTETTSGDYKIHTFTSSGNFIVTGAGSPGGSNKVSYMVVAGGGGARCAGAGAGGFREGKCSSDPYTDSPLDAGVGLSVPAATYPITIGAGGAGGAAPGYVQTSGSPSSFSSITSTGGGKGGFPAPGPQDGTGEPGGSGGGSTQSGKSGGTGNTPPVSPPQGNPGGSTPGSPTYSGGGGGATSAGGNTPGPAAGGTGVTTSISASPVGYAGGGAGAAPGTGNIGREPTNTGGAGIAGTQSRPGTQCGVTNRGGGGGGVYCGVDGNGGSGIVIIRYKFQN